MQVLDSLWKCNHTRFPFNFEHCRLYRGGWQETTGIDLVQQFQVEKRMVHDCIGIVYLLGKQLPGRLQLQDD